MNRRAFFPLAAAAGAAPLSLGAVAPDDGRQYLELRRYELPYGGKQRRLHDYLANAAIPALNRHGVAPIGVFNVVYGQSAPSLYVLIAHDTIESVATLRGELAEDAAFIAAAGDFLDLPLDDPGYVRYESELMRSFAGMPRVEVPAGADEGRGRIFELRRYESHSDPAALRKIEMFDEGGELAIFRNVGLTPVFFAEGLVGQHLPHLTYMLVFDDMRARDEAWDRFRNDPEWDRLSADPYYANTVSAITDVILRPTGYSQV